ncbi:hypothetical protein HHK36_029964 [Tetracentron sinense]|uniref:GAG-pre-integrase domain-containing protein n=1 Tax=Tetracentron sinense TaxID=13715 RepID=A0A834YET0_TETSI|nr:hypothetical protein HHK36_029964 [Tetracentron sinense]
MEKNNVIRPRPRTFSKSPLWLRRETTSINTNQSGDMLVISSPKLPLDDDMLWWENRLAEKEEKIGTSCSVTGLGEEAFTGLWDEDMEPATKQKTAENKAFLIRKLVNMKFKEGGPIAEHLNEFQGVVNQLTTMKLVIDDELQALLLLSSLPDCWETLVVTVSNSASNGELSMSLVTNSLFNEETRRKSTGTDNAQALVIENRGRTAMSSEDVVVLSFGEEEYLHVADQDIEWVVDTAASYHATPNKEFFTSYKVGDFGTVKMGNTSHSKIMGIGDGYENYFGNGRCKLTMGSLVVAKGKTCFTLYKTHAKVCKNELNAVEDSSSPNLWHKRLGHMSEKGLQIMAKKALIPFAKDSEMTEKSKGVVDDVSNFTPIPSPLQHIIADGEVHEEIGSDDTQDMIDDEMPEHEVVEQGEQPTQQASSESQVRSSPILKDGDAGAGNGVHQVRQPKPREEKRLQPNKSGQRSEIKTCTDLNSKEKEGS